MRKRSPRPDDRIDLSLELTGIIQEIVARCLPLGHIDVNRVLVCVGSNRSGRGGGLYGKLIPLRFKDGSPVLQYRGRLYAIPEISNNGHSCLYVIYFYMPRFFDLPWEEKLRVIFHELYHISPRFDGDIRRMGAVKKAHGHSKKHFDSLYAPELRTFSMHLRDTPHMDFLSMNSRDLYSRYRRVTAVKMKHPRPVIINC
ncbi:MAG TPA: putative metallopeptidase [Spirochaetota bacterium]|nr:putative metallopeptidase [Spirochaetota bacterium]HPC39354.1 putative metallopeptidase [Spirochaetota bacterium]HPL15161.1 putative metallopeptidase [Spirochaetota bacterium]HQF08708.1 putative metallopeptidase [Spirochaetota bacterium]HQH97591.1 putative metallopeptidase [Spirochaetota bacterium]